MGKVKLKQDPNNKQINHDLKIFFEIIYRINKSIVNEKSSQI